MLKAIDTGLHMVTIDDGALRETVPIGSCAIRCHRKHDREQTIQRSVHQMIPVSDFTNSLT
jgi:hypothetical protein